MEINICLASDDNYAKFTGVHIKSVAEMASTNNLYNVYILDGGITEINKTKLLKLETELCKIHFVDMKAMVKDLNLESLHVSGHISLATYYRLFLPNIFTNIDKILYVDCDTVFIKDPAEIYSIDLENYLLGAVRDIGLLNDRNRGKWDSKYFEKNIALNDFDDYFNAGVILYNLKAMREYDKNILEIMQSIKKPKFHDQCYLNKFAAGKVKYLPFIWNYWGGFKIENPDYKNTFPKKYLNELEEAAKAPGIIHAKPWNNPDNEWSEAFFEYARKTPFYETILYPTIKKKTVRKIKKFLFFKIKYRV